MSPSRSTVLCCKLQPVQHRLRLRLLFLFFGLISEKNLRKDDLFDSFNLQIDRVRHCAKDGGHVRDQSLDHEIIHQIKLGARRKINLYLIFEEKNSGRPTDSAGLHFIHIVVSSITTFNKKKEKRRCNTHSEWMAFFKYRKRARARASQRKSSGAHKMKKKEEEYEDKKRKTKKKRIPIGRNGFTDERPTVGWAEDGNPSVLFL